MDDRNSIRDEYATRDLYIAAFLRVKGQIIKKLQQRTAGSHDVVFFIFEDIEKCEELESIFWTGIGDELMVNVKEYFTTIRELKSRMSLVRRVYDRSA